MANLLFDYKIQKTAEIFEEDSSFKYVLAQYGLYIPDIFIDQKNPERTKLYEEISSLFLANYDFISDTTIDNLWSFQFVVNNLNQIFNKSNIVDFELYRQIFFTFKYSTIKHFFQDNFTKFLPSPDASAITNNEKMKLFQIAFMKEYDRFADIIDRVYDIVDIDKIDNEYLSYLMQLLGYEKGDDGGLLGYDSFRQLAKNIIEVYKMKGTNYSFELFFNFLGFEINLKEFWFDKRFSDPGISVNPFTNSTNPTHFAFYLTPIKPTMYIPKGMNSPYQVMENNLTDIRSSLWFEKLIYQGVPIEKLLNKDPLNPPEEGFNYCFFKTNVIQYTVKRIRSKETDSDELSAEDEKIINAYADFLTPIFIIKQVAILVSPFEDAAEGLYLLDNSYYNINLRTLMNMWKHHVEKFIYDDWVDDPLEPWNALGRTPLRMIDQTNVESNIDNEEPREVVLLIDSQFEGLNTFFTNDVMTNMQQGLMFLCEEDNLKSIWDIVLTDQMDIPHILSHIAGINGDEEEGISKILSYGEEIHNRIHRLEELNIFSRDYIDWGNFEEIRVIPNFADSADLLMPMNEFYDNDNDEITSFSHTGGGAAETPWLFNDILTFIIESNYQGIRYTGRGKTLTNILSDRFIEFINIEINGNILTSGEAEYEQQ